ncbi:MAG: beta-galactosidase [Candidatus Solibacter sp.]|nr:beta-galactosidase [Candidatus Solibacter sp.]
MKLSERLTLKTCMWLAAACAAWAADPVFPYGAVYFRKSNPPEQDWARDHKTAAQTGMNTFRHWFMWSAIETAPDRYDWRDYDRMMDLAAENGIKVVIAEMVTAAPEWMFDKYPHARFHASDDSVVYSGISGSSATGGFPGLCLDNEDVRLRAEKFLTLLVERYRNHPALLGYDLWNEHAANGGTPQKMYCYCHATQARFREWLKARYRTLDALGSAWYRYSYAEWDNVHPPRSLGGYPESLDWLEFRADDAFRLLRWRSGLFRRLDPRNRIVAHGVAGTLEALPSSANDEWRSAREVDTWGFTWVASRKGADPWKQFHAVDLVRAGARGKPFWHAEAQAGPLWMQPQVTGRPREDGRITDEKDVRLWNLISMAGGATGILYPRWRPLLDGPLFGAFGAFGMDGSVTTRAEMAGQVARWANANPDLWKSRPVRGDIGIVFVPESEIFNYVQQGSTAFYAESARGAYQAFFDSNIQADWVHIDDISEYPAVYLPYPVMLKEDTARKLIEYVRSGGKLISEGLPAYFGDRGHAGTVQPNLGLDRLFGAAESYVEFTPDLLERLTLTVFGHRIDGRFFLQEYAPQGGKASGTYENGHVAALENSFGKGRTLLIGSFPGAGYFLHHGAETRALFARLLAWAGIEQAVVSPDSKIKARVHTGPGGTYLWAVNPTRASVKVRLQLRSSLGAFRAGADLWQHRDASVAGRMVEVTIEDRSAAVIQLRR